MRAAAAAAAAAAAGAAAPADVCFSIPDGSDWDGALDKFSFYSRRSLHRWHVTDDETVGPGNKAPTIARRARSILTHRKVESVLNATVLVAGAATGIQSYDFAKGSAIMSAVEGFIFLAFTVEMLLKVAAESSKPLRYFDDAWNTFDFSILFMVR